MSQCLYVHGHQKISSDHIELLAWCLPAQHPQVSLQEEAWEQAAVAVLAAVELGLLPQEVLDVEC